MGDENQEGSARVDQASAGPSEPRHPTSDLQAVTRVNDFNKDSNLPAGDRVMAWDGGSVTRPILAVIVVTVVLYFGKNILLSLAMASILAVAFSPITSRLEMFVGRFASAALVVVVAITAIGVKMHIQRSFVPPIAAPLRHLRILSRHLRSDDTCRILASNSAEGHDRNRDAQGTHRIPSDGKKNCR